MKDGFQASFAERQDAHVSLIETLDQTSNTQSIILAFSSFASQIPRLSAMMLRHTSVVSFLL